MPVTKPEPGQNGWAAVLNAGLDYLDAQGVAAQQTANQALAATAGASWRPSFGTPPTSQAAMMWAGAAGHPYSSVGASGTFNYNDSSDFVLGSQSIAMTTNGAGQQSAIGVYNGPAMNMTGKCPLVWLKVTGQPRVLDFKVWLGSSAFAHAYRWDLKENPIAWPWLQDGQWVRLTLPIGKATVVGTPNPASLMDFQIAVFDNSSGLVTIQWGGLAFVPDGSAAYPNGVVSFTFDDGLLSQWTTARPYLDRYGYRATAYLIAEILQNPDNPAFVNYLKLAEAHKLQDFSGWDIGTHCNTVALHNQTIGGNGYTAYSPAQQLEDMRLAKAYLGQQGFAAVDHFAYPQGAYDHVVRASVQQTFASGRVLNNPTFESVPPADLAKLRSWAPTNSTPLSGPGSLQEAVDRAKAGKEWLVLTLHDIVPSPTGPLQISTANFQGLVDYINSSNVAVRTVTEVLGNR